MFKKILLPLDLSHEHRTAIEVTAQLAKENRADVILLHVIEVIAGLSIEEEKPFYDRLRQAAERHLQTFVKTFTENRIACQGKVLLGNRVRQIVDYAADGGADLIVLSVPGFDPETPIAGWGSLSYRIGLLAKCPLLLVKRPPHTAPAKGQD
jgi:universal stress protein A